MARSICLFPPNFAAQTASDHALHRHLSKAEAREKEQRAEIVRLDVAGTKYVERGQMNMGRERIFTSVPRVEITYETILRAHAGGGPERAQARRQIENYGAHIVAVPHLTFDEIDVWVSRPEHGQPVLALLRQRDARTAERVRRYLALRWPRGGPIRLTDFGNLLEQRRRGLQDSALLLSQLWPRVLLQFWAGEFSAPLNHMCPDQLPGIVVHWTLGAYLA